MFGKLDNRNFLADVRPLLTAEEAEKFDDAAVMNAFASVFDRCIRSSPGDAWATTPEMIKRHKLEKLLA